jgi:hypothetical protein
VSGPGPPRNAAAVQDIASGVTASGRHQVVPRAPPLDVVSGHSEQAIVARAAEQGVVPTRSEKLVVPRAATDHVVATDPTDHVVPATRDDDVSPRCPHDPVVPGRADDRRLVMTAPSRPRDASSRDAGRRGCQQTYEREQGRDRGVPDAVAGRSPSHRAVVAASLEVRPARDGNGSG